MADQKRSNNVDSRVRCTDVIYIIYANYTTGHLGGMKRKKTELHLTKLIDHSKNFGNLFHNICLKKVLQMNFTFFSKVHEMFTKSYCS